MMISAHFTNRVARHAFVSSICLVAVGCGDRPPHCDGSVIDVISASDAVDPMDASTDVTGPASDLPPTLTGYDAFRDWSALARVRIGTRTYMRSTFDRAGGNEGVDASHFIRQEATDRNITLDTLGPGVLRFVRTNHWHGSPWHYTVDDSDHVVTESSTAHPNMPVAGSTFVPACAFPDPLAITWSTTQGADLSWVTIPFEHSMQLAYGRTHYGTGYYIFQRFAEGADNLSQPVRAWNEEDPPEDVLTMLRHAGEDLAPNDPSMHIEEGTVALASDTTTPIVSLSDGAAHSVRALRFTVPTAQAIAFGRARLRITWDDRAQPSIDAPLALFFGAGTLFNRSNREYLVRGLLVSIRFDASANTVTLQTLFPMPYFRSARIEIVNGPESIANVGFHVRTEPYTEPTEWAGYFHATYVDHHNGVVGEDLELLNTTGTEGSNEWCGTFTGTSFVFSDNAVLPGLEGDPRFFFDDSQSPQAQGTGTEEWGGGGDYWGGQTMTLPFAGHPVGAPDGSVAMDTEDRIESAYRLLLADAMPFGFNARIHLEHGGENTAMEHYQSVTYWYGRPHACLVRSDSLHVGDPMDEAMHHYDSPTASAPETLTSRYELGIDATAPQSTDTGRHMTGTSEFTLGIDPMNAGVMLRRKMDQSYADQRAEVWVADADAPTPTFQRVGTWYTAGSNQCVYSNPPGEEDPPYNILETSNRRWREDEFLIARRFTRGMQHMRVQIRFVPGAHPLVPNGAPPPSAWSEFRYTAYSYVL